MTSNMDRQQWRVSVNRALSPNQLCKLRDHLLLAIKWVSRMLGNSANKRHWLFTQQKSNLRGWAGGKRWRRVNWYPCLFNTPVHTLYKQAIHVRVSGVWHCWNGSLQARSPLFNVITQWLLHGAWIIHWATLANIEHWLTWQVSLFDSRISSIMRLKVASDISFIESWKIMVKHEKALLKIKFNYY